MAAMAMRLQPMGLAQDINFADMAIFLGQKSNATWRALIDVLGLPTVTVEPKSSPLECSLQGPS